MLLPEFFVLRSRELKFLALGLADLPSDTLYPRIALVSGLCGESEYFVVLLKCYLELRIAIRCDETLVQFKVNDTSQDQFRSFPFLAILEFSISDFDKLVLLPI